MTNVVKNEVAAQELSIEELDAAAGGFWKELGVAMGAGGVTGGLGGAAVGGIGSPFGQA